MAQALGKSLSEQFFSRHGTMPVPNTPSRAQIKAQWELLEPLTDLETHLIGHGTLRLYGLLRMRDYGIKDPADLAFMFTDATEADQEGMLLPWQAVRGDAVALATAAATPCIVSTRAASSSARPFVVKKKFKQRRARPPVRHSAKTPAQDEQARRAAAGVAVETSMSWGPSAGLTAAWPGTPESQQGAFKAACTRRIMKFEARVIYQHLRVWDQWATWSEQRGLSLLTAALPVVEEFIETFTDAPTAGRSRWHSMAWLRTHLKSPYAVDPVHKPSRAATAGKVAEEQQAPVCEPELLVFLEREASRLRQCGDWRCGIVLGALVQTYGCMRFAHLQRSSLKHRMPTAFVGECFRGKSRIAGARPGFAWRCPAAGITGIPIAEWIFEAWGRWKEARPQHLGIICDSVKGNAVSLAQFNSIMKEILAPALDEDHRDTASVTSYSFRRVLPTLADIRQMPWEKRMPLGGWRARGEKGMEHSTMPIRYADRKDVTEQSVKVTAVRVLAAAVKGAEHPVTWEAVRAALPNVDTVAIETQVEKDIAKTCESILARGATAGRSAQKRLVLKNKFHRIAVNEMVPLPAVLSPQTAGCSARAWLYPHRGAGQLHFLMGGSGTPTLCRRNQKSGTLAFRGPATSGTGIIQAQALGKRLCPRCVQRLPLSESTQLSSAGGG